MQYICRTRAQTTDFSHNAGQKDESGCNSFKYDFRIPATSRAHGDTDNFRHHHGRVTPLRTPGHQTWSSISNCLVSPHIARAPKHWHRISKIQRALNIECPGPVSQFSLWSPAADPVFPSLCLKSRLASPTLTSTDRASHHTPDQVTGLRHTVTLGCFTPGGFYAKTQINLPICI